MSYKEFLERMLSMLPEEFQDIYDTRSKGDTQEDGKEGFFRKVLFLCYANV